MDISFKMENEKFNYRVCAIMISDNRLLALTAQTAEQAVTREIKEELGVTATIARPLWLNQAFFTEDVDKLRYHELCLYFLMDITDTDLLSRGSRFTSKEGSRTHTFEWLAFDRLAEEYFYPLFLKTDIFHLPDALTIRTEIE